MELLSEFFWFDSSLISVVLDVLLVSFLIYRLLLLVRGTRAEPMLLGLVIVAVIYSSSRILGLVTLEWLLGQFLGSVILVVVVLFQDDLRRGLTRIGLLSGFGQHGSEAVEVAIKEIAEAASELAERRIGALIVIKRDVGLEDYTEHAVAIDGIISHQLLVSIFLPTSPIHDGAVVVEGNKIVVAGAVLPLSFNPGISSNYGTRHRAAIGLSERTDAVVVVVSEETGTVSMIRDGRISKDLSEKTLYNALHRLTVVRQQKRDSLRGANKKSSSSDETKSKDNSNSDTGSS